MSHRILILVYYYVHIDILILLMLIKFNIYIYYILITSRERRKVLEILLLDHSAISNLACQKEYRIRNQFGFQF